ncbi:MAG: ATP-dependent DNA ligase [bacterium]
MQWNDLVLAWSKVEGTSLRNEKTIILSQVWQQTTPPEARVLCYLLASRVAPLYEPIEIGMAEKSLLRVVSWVARKTLAEVTQEYKRVGDIGEVIFRYLNVSTDLHTSLSIIQVYEQLYLLAMMNGAGSQEGKVVALGKLLLAVSPLGAKYVMRLVQGKLRLGLLDMTVIDALSWAVKGSKQDRLMLEQAYNVSSDLGMVAEKYLTDPTQLTSWKVTPGVPVRPMRAERLGTLSEIMEKLGECAVEPKLDGMRVQIHAFDLSMIKTNVKTTNLQASLLEDEQELVQIRVFSRGLENITTMFPEIVGAAKELYQKIGAFVLDGEAIGVANDGSFLPFQETMTRKRKYGIDEQSTSTPLQVVVFDVLYAKGSDCLHSDYVTRRDILAKMIAGGKREVLVLAKSEQVTSATKMQQLFDEAMSLGLEGILVKKLDSEYRAGARDFAWVKYKRAHETELADTIDAVVMGAYVGKGKRNKFGVGAFLVGVQQGEKVVTVAKIGTGLTDEQFGELFQKVQSSKSEEKNAQYDVPTTLYPDIWVNPSIVVEIEADEITESPLHTAGYALRFPRLLRFRIDKNVADITTQEEIKKLFEIGRSRL